MDQGLIDRINFLARKSRAEGLTQEERQEQERLRRQYIDAYKKGLVLALEDLARPTQKAGPKGPVS